MSGSSQDLLFLLHDVARLVRVEADKRARAHGMTRAQWSILFWVDRQPGLSQKELAEILDVEPITVGRLVDRLEVHGAVERRPDARDRRIWRLHLLPPARAVLQEMGVHRAEITAILADGIDPENVAVTIETLSSMKQSISAELRASRYGERPEARPDGALPVGQVA